MRANRENNIRPSLQTLISVTAAECTNCDKCVTECDFLGKYGSPGMIASTFSPSDPAALSKSFECTLCGLCTIICPRQLDLDAFFLEMRREAVDRGIGDHGKHNPLLNYEHAGTSHRFSLYGLPRGCKTVFFPGCSLSGSRPEAVHRIFDHLQQIDPAIGIVLDCCLNPSHILGREQYANAMFREMNDWLVQQGVQNVLVACPNCRAMFAASSIDLETTTIWEILATSEEPLEQASGRITIHDPCVSRNAEPVQNAVRALLRRQGLTVEEMPHTGKTTLCCGLGGAVNFIAPEKVTAAGTQREKEAAGRRIITYCASCAQTLGIYTPTSHLIDVLFRPEQALAGKLTGAKAPFTYLNRLRLKRAFKRRQEFALTRERTFRPPENRKKKNFWKPLILIIVLAMAIAGVHLSGAATYLQEEKLRELVASYGALAPAIYILIYALAPVLFLPGLPLTIAAGILFGPFFGVIYAITGASIGASLAFLVARYMARDWVAARLKGPKWQKLDAEAAKHGWKAVAFTRLIPAFPFNLLNYAFGLTSIPFLHYVIATFICMLPACIAFIVFSSSLLGLIKGQVSLTALLGIGLIALVSLMPVIYRTLKKRGRFDQGDE